MLRAAWLQYHPTHVMRESIDSLHILLPLQTKVFSNFGATWTGGNVAEVLFEPAFSEPQPKPIS